MEIRPFIKEHGYVIFNVINNALIGHQKDLSFIDKLEVDHCFTAVKNSQPKCVVELLNIGKAVMKVGLLLRNILIIIHTKQQKL